MVLEELGKNTMLKLFFYLILFTLSLGQFSKIAVIGETPLYLFDVIIGIYAIIGIFYTVTTSKKAYLSKYLILFFYFTSSP